MRGAGGRFWLALILLVGVGAGCGGGAGKASSGKCKQTSECGSGKVCYMGECMPMMSGACTRDGECAGGKTCQAGMCVAGGTDAGPVQTCSASQPCATGTCVNGVCKGGMHMGANGEACNGNNDCQSNLCQNGVCTATTPIPGGCTDDAQCAMGSTCQNGVCQGAHSVPNGGICTGNNDCQSGLCVNGTCQPAAPPPQCSTTMPCPNGETCTRGLCDGNGTGPNGSPCLGNADCQSRLCLNGTCTQNGPAPMCQRDGDCAQGATCVGGICQGNGMVPNGQTCTGNADCQSGLCMNGVCTQVGPPPMCTSNAQCAAGATCVNGVCNGTGTGGNGSPCTGNGDCQSGLCLNNLCSPGGPPPMCTADSQCALGATCQNGACVGGGNVGNGGACTGNNDCTSRFCVSGVCQTPPPPPMCTSNAQCAQGATCVQGACQGTFMVPNGGACTGNGDCLSLSCVGGTCTAPPGPIPGGGQIGGGGMPPPPPTGNNSNNVTTDPMGNVVLPPPMAAQTSSFLWIANDTDGAGTVSKIDSRTGVEVGRYRIGLPIQNNRPSRTAIDLRGNAYVASRALGPNTTAGCGGFACFNEQGSVTKIANNRVDCIDRNGNGVIDTSTGPTDLKALGQDECVLWTTPVGPPGGWPRALAVGLDYRAQPVFLDGIPWVGTYYDRQTSTLNGAGDHCYGIGRAYKLDPNTGAVLNSIQLPVNPYGFAIDGNARLWAMSDYYAGSGGNASNDPFRGAMTLVDLNTETVVRHPTSSQASRCASSTGGTVTGFIVKPTVAQTNPSGEAGNNCRGGYGIAVDKTGRVWTAGWSCRAVWRYTPGNPDLTQGTFATRDTSSNGGNTRGIAVDGRATPSAWVVHDTNPSRLIEINLGTMAVIRTNQLAGGSGGIGVQSDLDGKIWVVNNSSNNASAWDVTTNAVSLTAPTPAAAPRLVAPYTYSDFTGFALRTFTRPNGSYSTIFPGCANDPTSWGSVTVSGTEPANTELKLRVRVADTQVGLSSATFSSPIDVTPGSPINISGVVTGGHFIQVEVDLISSDGTSTPSLSGVGVTFTCPPPPCTDPSNCPGGQVCVNQACTPCMTSSQCQAPLACVNGTCTTPTTPPCQTNVDCTGGQVCISGVCNPCTLTSQCTSGQVCQNGTCVTPPPPPTCQTTGDCTAGQVCINSTCVPCSLDSQCSSGQVCQNGTCVIPPPPPTCVVNTDCSGSRSCINGTCAPCTLNAQCDAGQVCQNGTCITPPPPMACTTTADCAGGRVCVSTMCTACTASTQCPSGQNCQNGTCTSNPPPSACQTTTDCPSSQACINGACAPCTVNGECSSGMVCQNGSCVPPQCLQNRDSPATQACLNGFCGACNTNGDCAAGEQCNNGSCQPIRPHG